MTYKYIYLSSDTKEKLESLILSLDVYEAHTSITRGIGSHLAGTDEFGNSYQATAAIGDPDKYYVSIAIGEDIVIRLPDGVEEVQTPLGVQICGAW